MPGTRRTRYPASGRRSRICRCTCNGRSYLLHVAKMVEPLSTDHLLSPAATMVKQLGLLPLQVVQKPSFDNCHVPSPLLPAPTGARFILPSGVYVILNFRFDGVAAAKGWPVKNVDWMSAGASLAVGSAKAAPARTTAETETAMALEL